MFGKRNNRPKRSLALESLDPRYLLVVDFLITEINYNPYPPTEAELAVMPALDNDEFEFIEFYNDEDVQLFASSFQMIAGVTFTFPGTAMPQPGEFGVVVRNQAAFELRYGTDINVYGEFESGSLNNGGEDLELTLNGDAGPQRIFRFDFSDKRPWPARADGDGSTLELIRPGGTQKSELSEFFSWRASTDFGGSPGRAGTAPLGVTINEVLAHTDAPITAPDSIELTNQTNRSIDVGGWFLSDNRTKPFKFEIPAGTVLGPFGSIFYGEPDFNPDPSDPGPNDFALSGANGDEVILVIPGDNGEIGLYVDDVRFGATPNGESLGFLPGALGGLAPLESVTLGCANYVPRVGPVLITEIQYNPVVPSSAARVIDPTFVVDDLEFVEFHNSSPNDINLTEWRLRGAATYNFLPDTMFAAGETLIIVSWDPDVVPAKADAFRADYNIGSEVRILGPFAGELNNAGEQVRLTFPDEPPADDPTNIPRMLHDWVTYLDEDPFPNEADGDGSSLQRRSPTVYGDFGASWVATPPTPGTATFAGLNGGDVTGNGVSDPGDVESIRAAIRDGRMNSFYDIDSNSTLNEADVAQLVEVVVGTFMGDANLDGVVDSLDFNLITHGMNSQCHTWGEGDFNGDRQVNSTDVELWQANVSKGTPRLPAGHEPDRIPQAPFSAAGLANTAAAQPIVIESLASDTLGDQTSHRVTRQLDDDATPRETKSVPDSGSLDSPQRVKRHVTTSVARRATTVQLHDAVFHSLGDWDRGLE